MLGVGRGIVEGEKYVENGEWESWGGYLFGGKELSNGNVGIYGMGDIGKGFGRR
ncbi:NAD(P)-dependent oxidoreductase, partial [Staphylococcus saprophyticus]|uniref:NAD(P)-dependent oxidoreductase n=1 Tax=Staphylococcus saprophyticus TaxID=29385 RepID=UPI003703CDFE